MDLSPRTIKLLAKGGVSPEEAMHLTDEQIDSIPSSLAIAEVRAVKMELGGWLPWLDVTDDRSHSEGEGAKIYNNGIYQVIKHEVEKKDDSVPGLIWLSIKTVDNVARHDWRHFQRIKNELCGPEWEAIEMYPAESRLVDTSNQYHLWCFEPPYRFPMGFDRRFVLDEKQAKQADPRTNQRPFEWKVELSDLPTQEEMDKARQQRGL